MNLSSTNKSRIVAALFGLASVAAGGTAFAHPFQDKTYTDRDVAGNNIFMGGYGWQGDTKQDTETSGTINRASSAYQRFWTDIRIVGFGVNVISVSGEAHATHDTSSVPYGKQQRGNVKLLGTVLYNANDVNKTCPGKSSVYGCSSFSRTLTKTLYEATGQFTLIIPITVSSSARGSIHGALNMDTYSTTYLGKANSFYGRATTAMDAGGYVTTRQTVAGGVAYVFEVGLGLNLTLIDVSYTPSMQAAQTVSRNASTGITSGRRLWNNHDTLTLNTLSGNVEIYAKALGAVIDTLNLISWNGYTWTGDWVNDSGFEDI